MIFHVLTIFPEMITDSLQHSIIGRAMASGVISVLPINIRDFAINKHGQVDDAPYGGGAGMVMMAQPIYDAYQSIRREGVPVIYLTPQGRLFNQQMAKKFALFDEVILLCGHYEGVDERVIEEIVTHEVSIGDYILTGGETAAIVFIDAVSRLVPGVLGKKASHENESFEGDLLEHPHYTRPAVFLDRAVPAVLLSGHHGKVAEWRREMALRRTQERRG